MLAVIKNKSIEWLFCNLPKINLSIENNTLMNGIVNQYIKTSYKRNGPKSWLFVVSVNHHRATGSNVFVPGRACTRTMRVVANHQSMAKAHCRSRQAMRWAPAPLIITQAVHREKSGCFSIQLIGNLCHYESKNLLYFISINP